jgi:hypothetical protein
MVISNIISKLVNIFLLVFGFISFCILNQNLKYRYYQWVGLRSAWVKKILFKKLL